MASKLQKTALERARANYGKMTAKQKQNMGEGTATKVDQNAASFADRRRTEEAFGMRRKKK